ncbi:DNA polymerase theta [Aureococcus anophagefferens]|uniref:DNA polymerase theta n=1 Tax=Aureococcus anophagefferens TaxID=44056 RepID=A0ABR1G0X3_AURAN
MPWSLRFFEAIMAGSIPILTNQRHAGRNHDERALGYKYLLVSEARIARDDARSRRRVRRAAPRAPRARAGGGGPARVGPRPRPARASLASAYAEPEVAAAAAPPSAPAPTADGGVRPPIALDEVYVCDSVGAAEAVLARLEAADPAIYHAVDTEVDDIDLSREGPVGNGRVTCFTVYSGPDFSYDGEAAGKALFVDCVDAAVLDVFAPWFADESRRKVWHNYGFDRHVVENHGLACRGFAGDTMHMARLHDSSRLRTHGGDGYSLEALSRDLISAGEAKVSMKALFPEFFRKTAFADRAQGSASRDAARRGLDILRMQTDDATRDAFVCYAAYDAKSTWQVHDALRRRLERQAWAPMTDDPPRSPETPKTMWDFYERYFVPFGKVLTDMEAAGIYVDAASHLTDVEKAATADKAAALKTFRDWAVERMGPDGALLNPASSKQIQTLLFGGAMNQKTGEYLETEREFDVDLPPELLPDGDDGASDVLLVGRDEFYALATAARLKEELKKRGLKLSGTKAEVVARLRDDDAAPAPRRRRPRPARPRGPAAPRLRGHRGAADGGGAQGRAPRAEAQARRQEGELRQRRRRPRRLPRGRGVRGGVRRAGAGARGAGAPDPRRLRRPRDALRATPGLTSYVLSALVNKRVSPATSGADFEAKFVAEDDDDDPGDGGAAPAAPPPVLDDGELFEVPRPAAKRTRKLLVRSVGLTPTKYTTSGAPSCTADVLRELAGRPTDDPPVYGAAHAGFGGGPAGEEACVALDALCNMGSIDTMLNTFINPLRLLADDESRVHCSLNLNTETGRLSSRRPNLQNQPALEKDQYFIRKAFRAKEGCALVVADYGQLELRLLAHVARCESMLVAFREGGCFHSRTAVGMFDHVREAVESGAVLLEKGSSPEDSDKPLVKDVYASERRRAKTLNFSIAYGKTAHGLAKDWGVKQEEAQDMLRAWYDDRPEVEAWQKRTIADAKRTGYTTTLMGRRRNLPDILEKNRALQGRGARAAINTPIQGSAADVVMMAMLKIAESKTLKDLGYTLLLQIHDEVILEGPEQHKEAALAEVTKLMEAPFDGIGLDPLHVDLTVDAKTAATWYEAK